MKLNLTGRPYVSASYRPPRILTFTRLDFNYISPAGFDMGVYLPSGEYAKPHPTTSLPVQTSPYRFSLPVNRRWKGAVYLQVFAFKCAPVW